ncbi:PilN domain-containing protein [Alkaliphilus serpentinus]|uniref:PilN domain-containing protein n=1 Tax=Alkaliphilus serpentinus TaxID=1482731 RepID=A0A833HML7_9FIRM|nr:PilN domain-containing protein [Alkaliphilus serpentinus]KAB3527586.1 PilN domain-containing protein [Alkaliphilus serpentinus]
MKDYNFFQTYAEKGEKQDLRRLIYIAISTVAIALLVMYPLFNHLNYLSLEKDIHAMEEVLDSSYTKSTIDRIDGKKEELETLRKYISEVKNAEAKIDTAVNIHNDLITTLTQSLPEGVYFQSLNISDGTIEISGIANSKNHIAQLEFNLKANQGLYDVFIPTIYSENGIYKFSITSKFKDVNLDED